MHLDFIRWVALPSCTQYENLTSKDAAVLKNLQLFVGLDPALAPPQLPRENIRCDAVPSMPSNALRSSTCTPHCSFL